MARGALAKEEVTSKILATFEGSFVDGKDIRIPIVENGEIIQIKCALTAAKTNIDPNSDGDFPMPINTPPTSAPNEPIAPTEDEKAAVAALLKSLNL